MIIVRLISVYCVKKKLLQITIIYPLAKLSYNFEGKKLSKRSVHRYYYLKTVSYKRRNKEKIMSLRHSGSSKCDDAQ